MNRIVRTVLGDIAPGELGFCDSHCHPLVMSDYLLEREPEFYDVRDFETAKKELLRFKTAGGGAAADCQPLGTGRATLEDVRLSSETGLHIIACTGFHMQAFYPLGHWTFTASEQELCDIYVSEITNGMYVDTESSFPSKNVGAKAGFIKNATETPAFNETDRRRLRAAAKASIITGAPMLCHTNKSALTHIPFLLDLGVNPKSIIVAHLDKSRLPARDYHLKIAEMGVYLEFDSIVNARANTAGEEAALIKEVLDAGFSKQLMLGSDPVRPSFSSYSPGGQGLDYIPLVFLPLLRDIGVSDRDIADMTVNTPRNAFSFVPNI